VVDIISAADEREIRTVLSRFLDEYEALDLSGSH
jgi:hypothetical protein